MSTNVVMLTVICVWVSDPWIPVCFHLWMLCFSAAETGDMLGMNPNFCFLAGDSKTKTGHGEYELLWHCQVLQGYTINVWFLDSGSIVQCFVYWKKEKKSWGCWKQEKKHNHSCSYEHYTPYSTDYLLEKYPF